MIPLRPGSDFLESANPVRKRYERREIARMAHRIQKRIPIAHPDFLVFEHAPIARERKTARPEHDLARHHAARIAERRDHHEVKRIHRRQQEQNHDRENHAIQHPVGPQLTHLIIAGHHAPPLPQRSLGHFSGNEIRQHDHCEIDHRIEQSQRGREAVLAIWLMPILLGIRAG